MTPRNPEPEFHGSAFPGHTGRERNRDTEEGLRLTERSLGVERPPPNNLPERLFVYFIFPFCADYPGCLALSLGMRVEFRAGRLARSALGREDSRRGGFCFLFLVPRPVSALVSSFVFRHSSFVSFNPTELSLKSYWQTKTASIV